MIKKILLSFLILLAFAASSFAGPPTNLKQWYAGYNEAYFLGQLPANTVVSYGNPGPGNMAVTFLAGTTFHIVISPALNPTDKEVKITLLHELVHVKLDVMHIPTDFDGHGPAFTAEMRRLAAEGAMDDLW